MNTPLKAWVILIVSGGVWGVTFSLARFLVQSGAHPLGMNLWVGIIGSLALGTYLLAKRQPLPIDKQHLLFYLVCGLTGTVIPGTLLFYAAGRLPAGVLAITLAMVPMMTFLSAIYFRLESKVPLRILGVVLGLISIIMIAAPETSLPDPDSRIWVVIAVLASLLYCIENMVIALRKPRDTDAFTILCGMQILATIMMLPIVLVTDSFVAIGWPYDFKDAVLILMALINVFAYGAFIYLVDSSGPVFASQMAYVVTLAGVLWGILIFSESHSFWVWAALLVMMAGLFLVQPRKASPS